MSFVLRAFAAAVLTLAPLAVQAQDEKSWTREENYVYQVVHGVGLVMDIWRPTGEANGYALIDVLSGAWHAGQGQVNDHVRAGVYDIMCAHGYTVFMVRPGSRTKWTAEEMAANLHYATRYIRANAEKFAVNKERIGMMGASAGGHLTLLTAMTATDGNPEAKDAIGKESAKIQAVTVFFPPTDFLTWGDKPADLERLGDILFADGVKGKTPEEIEAKAKAISPALLPVPADMPPSLLIHGDADDVVPLQQSEVMIDALAKANTTHRLIVEAGGGHAWLTIREDVETMAEWLNTHLKR